MTTRSGPSPAARNFAALVGKRLTDLPAAQRHEIEHDLAARMAADGHVTVASIVATHGRHDAYADELRVALDLAPFREARQKVRRKRLAAAVAALVLLAGAVVLWRRDAAVPTHPLAFGSRFASGGASSVGSVFVLPDRTGVDGTIGIAMTNVSDRSLTVDGVRPLPGARALGDSGVALGGAGVGGAGVEPLWKPRARSFAQQDASNIVSYPMDDAHGVDLPVTLAPGATTMIELEGPLAYCVATRSLVTSNLEFVVTIGGRHRVVTGPEVSVSFAGCG